MVGGSGSLRPIAAIRKSAGGVMFVSDVHVAVEDEREVCFRVRSNSARRRKEGRAGSPFVPLIDDEDGACGRVLGAVTE